jgi:hypothetical protein
VEHEAEATVYEIAYAEAVRSFAEQHTVIDSFRTRAGLLLSAAAVTTSFLATQALHGGETSAWAWLGLAAFGGVAGLSLAILWPRHWDFAARPGELIESADQITPVELHRALSEHLDRSYAGSRATLENLALLFEFASSLLCLEVILWIVAIASGS